MVARAVSITGSLGEKEEEEKKGLCSDQYRCSDKLSIWPEILLDSVSINQTPLT